MPKLQGPFGPQSDENHDEVGRVMYPYEVVTKVNEQDAHATSECPNLRAPWERNVYGLIQVKIGKRSVTCAMLFLWRIRKTKHTFRSSRSWKMPLAYKSINIPPLTERR